LPPDLPIAGEILTGHVRSIDTMSRLVVSVNCRVPASILDDVRAKLAALMGFNG
jgi:mRNA interferase MazF